MIFYLLQKQMALLETQADTSKFCQVFELPQGYISEALSITRILQEAIGDDMKFNLQQAETLVKASRRPKIHIKKKLNTNITGDSPPSVFNTFKQTLIDNGFYLSHDQLNQTYAIFNDAFSNLHQENKSAWIFWSEQTQNKTTYQYRTLYATVQDKQLIVAPLALTITVNIITERVLCHTSTSTHCTALIEGLMCESSIPKIHILPFMNLLQMPNDNDAVNGEVLQTNNLKHLRTMPIPSS
ncbi:MAG: hypothetical protein AAF518_26570 [Spirochaetota bacterium]